MYDWQLSFTRKPFPYLSSQISRELLVKKLDKTARARVLSLWVKVLNIPYTISEEDLISI